MSALIFPSSSPIHQWLQLFPSYQRSTTLHCLSQTGLKKKKKESCKYLNNRLCELDGLPPVPRDLIFAPNFLASTAHPRTRPPKETAAVPCTVALCVWDAAEIINYWVSASEFSWLPSTCLPNFSFWDMVFQPLHRLSLADLSVTSGPKPSWRAASVITSHSFGFTHPFHKGSGKKDHCSPEHGGAGKETRHRQQHLATLWLRARTRSYELETWNVPFHLVKAYSTTNR